MCLMTVRHAINTMFSSIITYLGAVNHAPDGLGVIFSMQQDVVDHTLPHPH